MNLRPMHIIYRFKSLFVNYLAIIAVALILILFRSNYEPEIALNVIENILFAFVLIGISFVIGHQRFRRIYGQLAFVGFCLTMIFETLYYLLFKVFISSSTLYLLFDTNSIESQEFLQSYIGEFEVFSALVLIAVSLFCFKKINHQYQSFEQFSWKLSLKVVVLIGVVCVYLKWSTNIVYNLPYLTIKSIAEYSKISKNLEVYTDLQTDLFKDATSTLSNQKEGVYVLIIGESTARSHMGLYGYKRQTTPNLNTISNLLWTYKNVISPNAHTIESVTKMLTLGNYESPGDIWNGSLIQLANEAGFKTFWLSNQRPVGMHESLVTKIARSASEIKFITTMHGQHNRTLDQALLPKLDAILSTPNDQPKFIIIHLAGTHMLYKNRYPKDRAFFTNPPDILFKSQDNFNTVNHYDNAVLNTDFIVRNIIDKVDTLQTKSAVLFLSDHGEELFQDAEFAGHNEDVATKNMYDIPFFLWQSERYKNEQFLTFEPERSYMTDDLFHSMAQLLQISSQAVDSSRSIFSQHFKPRPRFLLSGKEYDSIFNQTP